MDKLLIEAEALIKKTIECFPKHEKITQTRIEKYKKYRELIKIVNI